MYPWYVFEHIVGAPVRGEFVSVHANRILHQFTRVHASPEQAAKLHQPHCVWGKVTGALINMSSRPELKVMRLDIP